MSYRKESFCSGRAGIPSFAVHDQNQLYQGIQTCPYQARASLVPNILVACLIKASMMSKHLRNYLKHMLHFQRQLV